MLSEVSNLGRQPTLSSPCSWANWNHGSPKPKVQRLRELTSALLDEEERLTKAGIPRVFESTGIHTFAH